MTIKPIEGTFTGSIDTETGQLSLELTPTTEPDPGPGPEPGDEGFFVLPIGAGGFLVGMDYIDNANMVVRTDTYGAYRWDETRWVQVVTAKSLPSFEIGQSGGVYDIRISPHDNNIFAMLYLGQFWWSVDRGDTWELRDGFPKDSTANPNDNVRFHGGKMCFDPTDPARIFASTPANGLMVSHDSGVTWEDTGVPLPSDGKSVTVFVKADGTVLACPYGKGMYRSTNHGVNFEHLCDSPSKVKHMREGPTGVVWMSDEVTASSIWKLDGDIWTDVLATGTGFTVRDWQVVLPTDNPDEVWFIESGGFLDRTLDGGATAEGIRWADFPGHIYHHATDIPWLGWTREDFMSNGNAFITEDGNIIMSSGIGVWEIPGGYMPPIDYTQPLPNPAHAINWTSKSLGIEQLVANEGCKPPGQPNVLGCWDRAVFVTDSYAPDVFPEKHGPTKAFDAGWSVDFAKSDPSYLFVLANWAISESGWSNDKGETWNIFPAMPPNIDAVNFPNDVKTGGCISASTPDNIIVAPSNNAYPSYTLDRGQTWHRVVIPGTDGTETGWGWAYYMKQRTFLADPVTPLKHYAYNYNKGVYKTLDGGVTWEMTHDGAYYPFTGYNHKMAAFAADSFAMSPGQQGSPGDPEPGGGGIWVTTDEGKTLTKLPLIDETLAFGFGKAAEGESIPCLYWAGWADKGSGWEYGVWRCNNILATSPAYEKLGEHPLDSVDAIVTLWGDPDVYGRFHYGFAGSGFGYGYFA